MSALPSPPEQPPRRRWPMASLRTWLVSVILLATVPIALLMSWQIWRDVRDEQADRDAQLAAAAGALAQSVERELVSSIDALTILSYRDDLQRGDVAQFERALVSLPQLRPSWHSAFLVDREGRLLFDTASGADSTRRNDPDGALLRQVLAERRPAISNLVRQPDTSYATAIEVPVLIDGQPRYVLGAWIDAAVWQRLLERSAPPPNGFMALYDGARRIVARTAEPQRYVGQTLPPAARENIRAHAAGNGRGTQMGGAETYVAWRAIGIGDWGVGVGVDAAPIDAAQANAVAGALGTAAACLLLGVTLALLAARRLARPLQLLAAPEDPRRPLPPIEVLEVAALRDALAGAAQRDELALEKLQGKADEFETLFAASPIGLAFAQDPQCRVVLHNAAMDRLFGALAAHATGVVRVLRDGRPLERSEQPLQRAAASGQAVPLTELEVRAEGQAPTWVLANAVPLRGPAGQPRGAIGAVVDVTEAKLAEARLQSADRRLRESQHLVDLAQEAGGVGFFQYQFEPDVMIWTPGLAKLFGFALAEPSSPLDEWLRRIDRADRTRVEHALRHLVETRDRRETLDYRVTPPDGSAERWLSSRVLIHYGEDGRALQMIGVTVDMTEPQRVERERAALMEREQSARLEAEAANRAKDEFLAMLGHELRNPLSAIASAVELLNRVDAQAEIAQDAKRIIARQTRHLGHLMDDLLDVARVISGKVMLSKGAVNLAPLVRRVADTLQLTGDARGHTLGVAELQDVWIDADATRIEQVASNLLTNAIKYTPAGGAIELRVSAEDGAAVLRVKDSGVGIAPNLLPHIFDLFVQGERTLDRRAGGLGIGLTLVRRLVQLHGGTIEARSAPGQGSQFTVRLPAIAPPRQPLRERPQVNESRRRRVGIVEDNEDALAALRSLLELDGHTVWSESDGVAGLAAVVERRPDVAVVDIGLPGLDGFELAKRSRAAGYAGRMIALSGYGQDRDIQRALQSGFDAHLVKPVNPDALRRMLTEE